jgi:OOP family OmpA-OmpF porin
MLNKKLLATTSLAIVLASTSSLAGGYEKGEGSHNHKNWYAGIHGGYTMAEDHDFTYTAGTDVDTELDPGYAIGLTVGYDYGIVHESHIGLRNELEFTYRNNEVDTHSTGGSPLAGPTGELTSHAFMANTIAYHESDSMVKPYIGAGIGFAMVEFEDYGVTAIPNVMDDDDTVFAYQGIVGAEWEVNKEVAITTDYRYFATLDPEVTTATSTSTETSYGTHNFLVGVKFKF